MLESDYAEGVRALIDAAERERAAMEMPDGQSYYFRIYFGASRAKRELHKGANNARLRGTFPVDADKSRAIVEAVEQLRASESGRMRVWIECMTNGGALCLADVNFAIVSDAPTEAASGITDALAQLIGEFTETMRMLRDGMVEANKALVSVALKRSDNDKDLLMFAGASKVLQELPPTEKHDSVLEKTLSAVIERTADRFVEHKIRAKEREWSGGAAPAAPDLTDLAKRAKDGKLTEAEAAALFGLVEMVRQSEKEGQP